MSAYILLPFPPSVNTLYINVRGRGRATSGKYKDWQHEAAMMLGKQTLPKFDKRVDLEIEVGPGRANADCSNLIKAVEDTLVKHGILIDDSKNYVRSVKVSWSTEVVGCSVWIKECDDDVEK